MKKLSTEEFIMRAKKVHGEVYDYSLVDYKGCKDKVTIVCPVFGEFEQVAGEHLSGRYKHGIRTSLYKSKYFITQAKEVHGDKYDYALVEYVSNKTKVSIICSVHGKFEQTPSSHLCGHGCAECAKIKVEQAKLLSTNDFIKRAIEIHGDKYDYSIVNYTKSMSYVDIICKDHGVFSIKGNDHTSGKKGCPECAKYLSGWNYDTWGKRGNTSPNFDSFKLYVIKCYDNEEVFYKVGKTFMKINERFGSIKELPYKFEIIKIIEGSARHVSDMEKEFHKENKLFKYIPNKSFCGMQECFSKVIVNGNQLG